MITEASEQEVIVVAAPVSVPLQALQGMEEPDETYLAEEWLNGLRAGISPMETQLLDGLSARVEVRSHTADHPCPQTTIHDNGDVEHELNTIDMMNFDVFDAETRLRIGTIFVSSDGFLAGQIAAGGRSAELLSRGDDRFSVRWSAEHPFSGPYLRAQPAAREATTSDRCADGVDNDSDFPVDSCDENCLWHSDFGGARAHLTYDEAVQAFAVMGDAVYCRGAGETWCGELYAEGFVAAETLDQAYMSVGVETTYHHMELAHCYFFDSVESSSQCGRAYPEVCLDEEDAPACCDSIVEPTCPPGAWNGDISNPGSYPYAATGFFSDWRYALQWHQFDTAADIIGAEVHPVQMVGVRAGHSLGQVKPGSGPCPVAVGGIAGVAYSPYNSKKEHALGSHGAMMYKDTDTGTVGHGHTAAHEFGHLEGLQHDLDAGSFMFWVNGSEPTLSLVSETKTPMNEWLWLVGKLLTEKVQVGEELVDWPSNRLLAPELSPSKIWWPRPSGFRFVGCNSNAECRPLGRGGTCNNERRCVVELP
jgi:hypothetical protein